MGCGVQCSRVILFTLNIVFWLCGVAMLGLGLWLRLDDNAWSMLDIVAEGGMDDPLLRYSVYLVIGIGAFIMVVGFLGCTGVWKSNTTLLKLYTILVGVVLLAEIAAGILAVIFITEINETIEEGIQEIVQVQYGLHTTLTKAIDAVQEWLKCCGSTGYGDYSDSFYQRNTSYLVPESCCKMVDEEVENRTLCLEDAKQTPVNNSKYLNHQGCYDAMKNWAVDNIYILAGVLFGIAAIQIMGLILGCCLIRSLNAEKDL